MVLNSSKDISIHEHSPARDALIEKGQDYAERKMELAKKNKTKITLPVVVIGMDGREVLKVCVPGIGL